ncbi:MAG: hydrogenase [Candidatus Thermoplasmatota archaeon]|jgi:Ca2+/Na+ antiporter|nr:hydrogenase [Candidatus Thermoplasmatota archaeon]
MEIFNQLIETLKTGSGFWNPIVWVLIMIVAVLLVYVIRSFGKKQYKEKTEQTKSFLSGNPEYEKEQMRIKSSNVYWGFTEAMKWVYNLLKKMHNGNASDYVLWFVIIMSILSVLLILVGAVV